MKKVNEKTSATAKMTTDVKAENTTAALTIIPKQEVSTEEKTKELEAEIEKLKAKLNAVPQGLEAQIEYIQTKQAKIKKLKSYEFTRHELEEYAELVEKEYQENDIDGENFLLNISKKSYPERTVLKINNPVLIGEVINYIIDKMDIKIDNLRTEITM